MQSGMTKAQWSSSVIREMKAAKDKEEAVRNSKTALCKEEKASKHQSKVTQGQWEGKIKRTERSKDSDKQQNIKG